MSNHPLVSMALQIGELSKEKNEAYGDSFKRSGEILAILYPNGISPEQYRDALGVVRVIDKLFRIATRKGAFGESPWRDIAGYGVVGAAADEAPKAAPKMTLPIEASSLWNIPIGSKVVTKSGTVGEVINVNGELAEVQRDDGQSIFTFLENLRPL